MMHFKIDENLPVEIAVLFTQAGHNAETVFDENLTGTDDRRVYEACQKEGRALITLDLDFADTRRYPPGESAGIAVIRASIQEKGHVLALIARMLPALADEELDKHLWIIDESVIRIRGETSGT